MTAENQTNKVRVKLCLTAQVKFAAILADRYYASRLVWATSLLQM